MSKLMLIIFIFIFGFGGDYFYSMPSESKLALNDFTKSIKNAKHEIKATIYSFTHKEIAKALKHVAKNGVKVYIVYDYESNKDIDKSTIGDLAKINNIYIKTTTGQKSRNGHFGKLHSKTMIIDNQLMFFGSANWSNSAFGDNYEVLFRTNNLTTINQGKAHFEQVYNNPLAKVY